MKTDRNHLKELFEEKTLWDLLRVFEDAFPKPMRARYIGVLSGVLTAIALGIASAQGAISEPMLHETAAMIAGYSLTISAALMGVVIAGMSIFASSLKPTVAAKLIKTKYPRTEISSLKFMFSMFAYLLFSLFLVICFSGAYYVLLGQHSVGGELLRSVKTENGVAEFYKVVLLIYVAMLLGLTTFLLSILRSFIWNLHQVLMVVIATEQIDM